MRCFQFFHCVFTISIFLIIDLEFIAGYKLCRAKQCVRAGNQIAKGLDRSIHPCTDFYQHVCGQWIENAGRPTVQRDYLAAKQLKQLLEDVVWNYGAMNNPTIQKVQGYYESCTNLAAIDSRGIRPMESIVANNGDWPLIMSNETWNLVKSNLTIETIHKNYQRIASISPLFHIDVYPDPSDNGAYLLHLTPPRWLSLSNGKTEYRYLPFESISENRRAEAVFMKKVARVLADSRGFKFPSFEIMKKKIGKILKFRASLIALYRTKNKSINRLNYRVTTIAKMQKMWNKLVSKNPEFKIDWLESIRSVFHETNVKIDETEKIGIMPKKFLQKFARSLINSDVETVASYIHWVAITDLLPYTDKTMRKLVNELVKNPLDVDDVDDYRQYTCLDQNVMRDGLDYIYAKNNFLKELKNNVSAIVDEMKEKAKENIEKSSWIDSEAKRRYNERLDRLTKSIGYPKWYDDPERMNNYYSKLKIGDSFFENLINWKKFDNSKNLEKLRKPYDDNEADSEFVLDGLDAVDFQMPFYHSKRPMVMKYGAVGSLLGPALTHHFIDQGNTLLTENTVDNETRQWSDSMISMYEKKLKFIADQKSEKFMAPAIYNDMDDFNGTVATSETIEAQMGFTIALQAYKSYKKKHNLGDIREAPLQEYSEEQLFFYSLVNRLCEATPMDFSPYKEILDLRSSHRERINSALSNMDEFSKAFNCQVDDPMNLEKKIRFWD